MNCICSKKNNKEKEESTATPSQTLNSFHLPEIFNIRRFDGFDTTELELLDESLKGLIQEWQMQNFSDFGQIKWLNQQALLGFIQQVELMPKTHAQYQEYSDKKKEFKEAINQLEKGQKINNNGWIKNASMTCLFEPQHTHARKSTYSGVNNAKKLPVQKIKPYSSQIVNVMSKKE